VSAKLGVFSSVTTSTDTLPELKEINEPRVQWIFTSCVMHTFLVPALELLFLSCQYGDYKDENFVIVCREDGFAMELEADFMAFKMRILRTTETWQQMLKLSNSI
jgi:hypothetical protein